MAQEETYTITPQEALQFRLMQTEVEKAALALQLQRERLASFQRELSGKYSEYGKYELVGDLSLETLEGKRRLQDLPAVEEVDVDVSED